MRAIGIILAGGESPRMRDLTKKRATSAMPIAGVIAVLFCTEQYGKFPHQ